MFGLFMLLFIQLSLGQELRGPPRVETNVNLLGSYIPATMQIIAHLTETMKYEIKPPETTSTTTTTTVSPTSSHKPGVFAPDEPTNPQETSTTSRTLTRAQYLERLTNENGNYFDRYKVEGRGLDQDFIPDSIENYLSSGPVDILKLIQEADDDIPEDHLQQVQKFSEKYDDDEKFAVLLGKTKRTPPTRAYVTLLSLYDLLGKEAKRLKLNKYQGYTHEVLVYLAETSTGTAAYQLESALSKMVEKKEVKRQQIVKRIEELLNELKDNKSYLSTAIRYVPPLKFIV